MTHICYNDLSWAYNFEIKQKKLVKYIMFAVPEDGNSSADNFKPYNSVTIKPIVNKLHKKYGLDSDPAIVNHEIWGTDTFWTFGNGSVVLVLNEGRDTNTVGVMYQAENAANF